MPGISLQARRRWLGIGVPILLVGVVTFMVLVIGPRAAFRGNANEPIESHQPVAGALEPTATATSPVAAAKADAVRRWWASGPKDKLDAIADDFQSYATHAKGSDPATTLSAIDVVCRKLSQDVRAARALPASPDQETQRDWSTTVNGYDTFATACLRGTGKHQMSGLQAMGADIQRAFAAQETLKARVDAVTNSFD